jgi:hypothetical protein
MQLFDIHPMILKPALEVYRLNVFNLAL